MYDDDDDEQSPNEAPKFGAAKWVVLATLVVGLLSGGAFFMKTRQEMHRAAAEADRAEYERQLAIREAALADAGRPGAVPIGPIGAEKAPRPAGDPNAPGGTFEIEDIVFTVQEVKRDGNNLQVWFTCTSKGLDRVFRPSFVTAPPLLDDEGHAHTQGKWVSQFPIASTTSPLPADVPVRHGVEYTTVKPDAKGIASMEISAQFENFGTNTRAIRFRNLPIPYKR